MPIVIVIFLSSFINAGKSGKSLCYLIINKYATQFS